MAERSQPSANYSSWPVMTALTIVSLPLLLMYVYLFLDTVTVKEAGALLPSGVTLDHWRFLWQTTAGKANIWQVTVNTLLFSACTTSLVLIVSSMAGYVLSRLNVPARGFFLAGVMVLHAFPSVTLIIAIFIVLQMIGLYNSLIGVILVKAAIDLPLGIWLMKGFYDTVPWEIEMAGVVDGASRFRVWRSLVLPQVLAPGNDVQVLSVYLAGFLADDNNYDFNMFKAVGLFYLIPVLIAYALFNKYLMNIYGGGSKG